MNNHHVVRIPDFANQHLVASRAMTQPMTPTNDPNQCQTNGSNNAGEATTFRSHQVENSNQMMVIHVVPPASPLQNIDKALTRIVM